MNFPQARVFRWPALILLFALGLYVTLDAFASRAVTEPAGAEGQEAIVTRGAAGDEAGRFPEVPIHRRWAAVPEEFSGGIDAAVNWENGAGYWFSDKYLLHIHLHDRRGAGEAPRLIGERGGRPDAPWPGLPEAQASAIDAALFWDDHVAWFFRGAHCFRLDLRDPHASPRFARIARRPEWAGFPAAFHTGFDAAVNDGNGNIFFFRGDEYIRYDRYLEQVIEGPDKIAKRWEGLPPAFAGGLDAAMRIAPGRALFFRDGMTVEVGTGMAL